MPVGRKLTCSGPLVAAWADTPTTAGEAATTAAEAQRRKVSRVVMWLPVHASAAPRGGGRSLDRRRRRLLKGHIAHPGNLIRKGHPHVPWSDDHWRFRIRAGTRWR